MNRCRYFVVYDRDGWKIQCEGENSEPFETKTEAFRGAVALAHLDDSLGRHADVIVQDENDGFHEAWTSDRDPYPPPLAPI